MAQEQHYKNNRSACMKINLPGIRYMKCIFHLMKGFTCKFKNYVSYVPLSIM